MKKLGAGAATVGFVAGFGEMVGYAFRIVTGYLADRTRRYWLFTILGFSINLLAVPFLALAGNWVAAATLLVIERFGKAIRNPSRDAMLSHARTQVGSGWTFGLHEALDQVGAVLGPLIVAAVLYFNNGSYRIAFGMLLIPALLALTLVAFARFLYPHPSELEVNVLQVKTEGLGGNYWLYMVAVGLVAFGFADFPLIAYHIQSRAIFDATTIPLMYALAMGVDAFSALFFGWLYDRIGVRSLIGAVVISAPFAPLVFLGEIPAIWAGVIIWGIGMGWQESIMRSVVSDMAPKERRASAFGLFNAGYGILWFAGSWAIGLLYDFSASGIVSPFAPAAVSVAAQLAALPLFIRLGRK